MVDEGIDPGSLHLTSHYHTQRHRQFGHFEAMLSNYFLDQDLDDRSLLVGQMTESVPLKKAS